MPAYSPDGQRIAYAWSDPLPNSDYEIFTIDATGGTPFQVTNNDVEDSMLSYSPDGRNIAYTVFDGTDSEIYTIDHNGGTLIQVTNNRREDFEPSWGSLP